MTKAATALFFVLFALDIALIVSLWNNASKAYIYVYCGTRSQEERAAEATMRTWRARAKQPFRSLRSDVETISEFAHRLQLKFLRVSIFAKPGPELKAAKIDQESFQS